MKDMAGRRPYENSNRAEGGCSKTAMGCFSNKRTRPSSHP